MTGDDASHWKLSVKIYTRHYAFVPSWSLSPTTFTPPKTLDGDQLKSMHFEFSKSHVNTGANGETHLICEETDYTANFLDNSHQIDWGQPYAGGKISADRIIEKSEYNHCKAKNDSASFECTK